MTTLLTLLLSSAFAAEPTIDELLDATDDIARGASSVGVISMHVKTKRYERTMKMKAWSKGTEKTLIRILEPAKDAGISTLMVDNNIWNYLPKVDRTMKVPSGMMSNAWMGSHFSNDDLVKESRMSDDYTATLTAKPNGTDGNWVIELIPKPDAPVVYGKVEVTIRADKMPVQILYFDEKGAKVRTMTYADVRDFSGHKLPATMRLVPENKPGEFTEIVYEQLDFDADVPDSTFSLQALRR